MDKKFVLTKFFLPKILFSKNFFYQNFLDKINFFEKKFFWKKIFLDQSFFWGQKFFGPNFLFETFFRGKVRTQVFSKLNTLDLSLVDNISAVSDPILTHFFWTLVFLNQFFLPKFRSTKTFLITKIFLTKFFFS